jgi:hypothetical protein
MATWDIRSKNGSLSGETQVSIEEGNRFCSREEIPRFGRQIIREGIPLLYKRPATDLFCHDAPSWMDLVHQLEARRCGPVSGCPMVVMMESTHHGKSDHLLANVMRRKS